MYKLITAVPEIDAGRIREVIEEVSEEKNEKTVSENDLIKVISALKTANPYEEPIIDIYKLTDL